MEGNNANNKGIVGGIIVIFLSDSKYETEKYVN